MSETEQEQDEPVETGSPYDDIVDTPLWSVIQAAVEDLRQNNDLTIETRNLLITGYLCRVLLDSGLAVTEEETTATPCDCCGKETTETGSLICPECAPKVQLPKFPQTNNEHQTLS